MNIKAILSSALLLAATHSVTAQTFDVGSSLNKAKDVVKNKNVADLSSAFSATNLISMASEKLNLSPETTQAGIGALLNAAEGHLSKENFEMVSKALPDAKSYMKAAPEMKSSSLSSLLAKKSEKAQSAASLGYLDSAFKKLGIPKESILPLADMLTGYMESNGYGQAAGLVKQGLNFL